MTKQNKYITRLNFFLLGCLLGLGLSCVGTLKTPVTGHQTAILVEGLGSAPYLKNALNAGLEKQGYTVYNTNWKHSGTIKATVCIGHSFGGGRLMKLDVECGTVITLDAREWNASKNDSYVSIYKTHYNFWEDQDLLRGYTIQNAINRKIKSSHIGLPKAASPQVLEITKDAA